MAAGVGAWFPPHLCQEAEEGMLLFDLHLPLRLSSPSACGRPSLHLGLILQPQLKFS